MQHWHPAPAEERADLLAFTPVPRGKRAGGWTAERQRAFIAALGECGSVRAAARQVNMASEGAYLLRRHPAGASFAAAWDRAQAGGVRRLADIAIERATEGVPVPVFYKGEQVGERRSYNDRLLMFLMKHHLPADPHPLPPAPGRPAGAQRLLPAPDAEPSDAGEENAKAKALREVAEFLDGVFARYERKVAEERGHRLAGRVVAADFTLRQLTHIELILDMGGRTQELLALYTTGEPVIADGPRVPHHASPISELLDARRREVWARMGDPPRPPLDLRPVPPSTFEPAIGPTRPDREAARRTALAQIAAGQAMWEAAATEDSWRRFSESDED